MIKEESITGCHINLMVYEEIGRWNERRDDLKADIEGLEMKCIYTEEFSCDKFKMEETERTVTYIIKSSTELEPLTKVKNLIKKYQRAENSLEEDHTPLSQFYCEFSICAGVSLLINFSLKETLILNTDQKHFKIGPINKISIERKRTKRDERIIPSKIQYDPTLSRRYNVIVPNKTFYLSFCNCNKP